MTGYSGVIWVDQVMHQQQEQRRDRAAWQARARTAELRQEEREVLRAWWQADERDRPEVVQRHREVFARIHQNRKKAHRLEAQERAIQDAAMRARGYAIRPGRVFPR